MTNYRKHTLSTAIPINSALLLGACYNLVKTLKSIEPEPPEIQHKIRKGNRVYIQTKDGRALTLKVSHVTSEAIIGTEFGLTEKKAIPFDQIETLDKEGYGLRRMNKEEIKENINEGAKVFGMFVGALLLVAIVFLIVISGAS